MNSSKRRKNNRVTAEDRADVAFILAEKKKGYHNLRQRIGRLKRRKPTLRGQHKKLAELILYLCDKCKDDPFFDLVKLQWLLFRIDMEAYRRTGQSVTGCTYIKQ